VLLPKRRLRAFPRAVKRKMSNYQLKRAAHRAWPQPIMTPAQAVGVLPAPAQHKLPKPLTGWHCR
jgi:hypothetical protein